MTSPSPENADLQQCCLALTYKGNLLGAFSRPDLINIRDQIDELLTAQDPSEPRFEPVISLVAQFYRVSPRLVCGTRRDRKAAWPRQVAMTLCCESFPHLPITTIGRLFHRKHSTVSHARRCVLAAQKNAKTRADLATLRQRIQQRLSATESATADSNADVES